VITCHSKAESHETNSSIVEISFKSFSKSRAHTTNILKMLAHSAKPFSSHNKRKILFKEQNLELLFHLSIKTMTHKGQKKS
jgi:hypothetical protein